MVTYLAREAWTPVPRPRRLVAFDGGKVRGVAVHWTGSASPLGGGAALAQSVRRLEDERRFHVGARPSGRGWQDIAYNYAGDQAGRVFELRGVGCRSAANGDQAVNATHGAFLFLVGSGDVPSPELVAAFWQWRREVWLKRWPRATAVVGHRDLHSTECPGGAVQALVAAGEPPSPLEADVPLSDDDVQRIARAVVELLTGKATPHPVIVMPGTGEFRIADGRDAVTWPKALGRILEAVER